MKLLVETSIEELKAAFPDNPLEIDPDAEGGAYVRVNNLSFGENYTPSSGWVVFHITHTYPHSDIYGHHLPPEMVRVDHKDVGPGFHRDRDMKLGKFQGKALFISRKANHWNPNCDTAALNLRMILDWMDSL